MFNYSSLSILKVLLTSLCSLLSFAVPLPFWAMPLYPSSTTVFSSLSYIQNTKSLLSLLQIFFSLLLYSFFYILHIQLCFLFCYLFIFMLLDICYTIYSITVFRDKPLFLVFFWLGTLILILTILYKFSSSIALLGGMPYMLLYSCVFSHRECTGLSLFFCSLATCATSFSYFLLSTSIFGHSHL